MGNFLTPDWFREAMAASPTITIKLNTFQAGALQAVLWEDHRGVFRPLFEQLRAYELEVKKKDRVTIEHLEGGMVGLTDCDGTRIVREPYPWEVGEW